MSTLNQQDAAHTEHTQNKFTPWVAMALVSLISLMWSFSYTFLKIVPDYPSLYLNAGRIIIAAITIFFVAIATGSQEALPTRYWEGSASLAFFELTLPFTLIGLSIPYVHGTLASLINGFLPALMLLFSAILLQQKPNRYQIAGLVVGISSLITIFFAPDLLSKQYYPASFGLLAAMASYAYGSILIATTTFPNTRTFLAHIHYHATLQIIPFSIFVGWWQGIDFILPSHAPLAVMTAMAWLSSLLAFALFRYALNKVGVIAGSSIGFLIPIYGSLVASITLGEPLTLWHGISIFLIIISVRLMSQST